MSLHEVLCHAGQKVPCLVDTSVLSSTCTRFLSQEARGFGSESLILISNVLTDILAGDLYDASISSLMSLAPVLHCDSHSDEVRQ